MRHVRLGWDFSLNLGAFPQRAKGEWRCPPDSEIQRPLGRPSVFTHWVPECQKKALMPVPARSTLRADDLLSFLPELP
jgi:hypothetical protein